MRSFTHKREIVIVAAAMAVILGVSASAGAAPAQKTRPARTPVAATITPADIHAAAVAVGFTIRSGRIINSCEWDVEAPVQHDLNADGRKELIFDEGICAGNAGAFYIAGQGPTGKWIGLLGSRGGYEIMKTRHNGWFDIETGGPGCMGEDPRYSFRNGKYEVSGSKPRRC